MFTLCKAKQLSKSRMKVVKIYGREGFLFCLVLIDMESENFKDKLDIMEVYNNIWVD